MKDKKKNPASNENVIFMEDGKAVETNRLREIVRSPLARKIAIAALLLMIILIMLAVAGGTGWLSAERIAVRFADIGKGKNASENLPLEMNGLKVSTVDDIGYCFGVMDDMKYNIYSPEINQLYSFTHNMSSPVTVSSDKRVLMFERGNYKITVFSRKGELFTKSMEYAVITADINKKNEVAVATVSERYLSQVTVFDASGNEKLTWYSADNYITDVALSDDGKQLAVALLHVENGEEMSRVSIFNVGDTKATAEFAFDGETVFDLRRYGDGGFLAVGTSSTGFFNADGEMTGKYVYGGQVLSRYTVAGDKVVLVFDPHDGGKLSAEVINGRGEKMSALPLDGADYICGSQNGRFYVCNGGNITEYIPSENGMFTPVSLETDGEVIKLLPKDEKLLILSIDGINFADISQAEKKES